MTTDSGPLAVGRPFGSRYDIRRVLGIGGMGAVYEAWDKELGVAVALKVIRPETAADPQETLELERRFKRELLLARQVTHRNVVRIHDLGEIDGIRYITMALVAGTDLRSKLRFDSKLSVPEALTLAKQIAAGLQAAHEAGIVHRDLKPGNIMIGPEGRALIMDFGLARYTGPIAGTLSPSAVTGEALTVPPTAGLMLPDSATAAPVMARTSIQGLLGTLEYMAPEQARGGAVDARADIFAFGLIFHEMLAGLRPHREGISRIEAMWARVSQPPVGPRAADPAVPPALDAIVVRCLQIEPADRYQTMADVSAALDALDAEGKPRPKPRRLSPLAGAAAIVLVAVIAAGGTWWLTRQTVTAPRPQLQLLMASFKNSTNEPGLESTIEQAMGLALEGASFISTFPRQNALRIARAQFSATTDVLDESTARLIAIREGVDGVIAGTIEPRQNGYRLSVRALDAQGQPIAAQSTDAAGKGDLLEAVTRVASRLRDDFGDTTPASVRQKDLETFTTASLEAVTEYAKAQDLAAAGKYEDAITHYRAALAHDSSFGRAYSGWAVNATNLGRTSEADEAYKKALTLLDRMTEREKLRTLGAYYLQIAGNYDKAVETYSELVTRFPFDAVGHNNLAIAYLNTLDIRRAVDEARLAVRDRPGDVRFQNNLALFLMYANDFEAAAAGAAKISAPLSSTHLPIAIAAMDVGDLNASRAAYERMAGVDPTGASLSAHGLGDLAMFAGLDTEALAPLRDGAAADETASRTSRLLPKRIALAEAFANLGRAADAKALALTIVRSSDADSARVPAARVLARVGEHAQASTIASELASGRQPQSRAYGRILQGELALARRDTTQAIQTLGEARKIADLWLGRFLLGVSLVEAGAYAEAVSELDLAWKRRGEATALFLDDRPTFRYVPPVRYWLGRAHEGLTAAATARTHYEAFLRLRPATSRDPLAVDARKRLAALPH